MGSGTLTGAGWVVDEIEGSLARLATDPLTGKATGFYDTDGSVAYINDPAALDRYKVRTRGTLICDWRGTISGSNANIDANSICPSGAAVVSIVGEGTTDTTGNVQNNQGTMTLPSPISTVGANGAILYMRVPARNPARKNYQNVPAKILLSNDAVFTKYLELSFNVIADGKWRPYALDLANPAVNSGAFVLGTDSIHTVRIRPELSNGTATTGTAQLQVGETMYFGGLLLNPRTQAMCIVRFDDMLGALVSRKACVVSAPYVGASGITVPIGSYSISEIMSQFGLLGSCFIPTSYLNSGDSNFETTANLLALQSAGWEICFQTHFNPLSQAGLGIRLMAPPYDAAWLASQSLSHATDGTVTSGAESDIATAYGQTSAVKLIGTPPAPLIAGNTYFARRLSSTTTAFFNSNFDAARNINRIVFASGGSATWGWTFPQTSADNTATGNDLDFGIAAMKAAGLKGWMHWAFNNGAIGHAGETVGISRGIKTYWPINLQVYTPATGFQSAFKQGVGEGTMAHHMPLLTARSCALLDSLTEAQARDYVRLICRTGAIGQGLMHEPNAGSTLVLMAFCDELKLRQSMGDVVAATPTRVQQYLDAIRS